MPTLLQIDSSPRGTRSISRQLTTAFAEAWLENHPGGRIIRRDLRDYPVPHLDDPWINAARASSAERTAAEHRLLALSDELIAELIEGDHFVFGVPMYNYTLPSTLKAYIDTVIRSGVTVKYVEGGLKSLLGPKTATAIAVSSGSFQEGTPLASWNFLTPYLQKVLGLLASDNVEVITVDGLANPSQRAVAIERAHAQIRQRVQAPIAEATALV